MKDKKSSLKENNNYEYEEQNSLMKLIGLFIIVYCFVGITDTQIGYVLKAPFTYLFGSFGILILIPVLLLVGFYMLLTKKVFHLFSKLQYVMIALLILFILVLSSINLDSPHLIKFSNAFSEYNASYSWKMPIDQIASLGGGMIGYLLLGLLNTMTNNITVTFILSLIILVGLIIILLLPICSKIFKKLKIHSQKKKEKRKEKALLKEKKRQEEMKQEPIVNSEIVDETIPFQTNKPFVNQTKEAEAYVKETNLSVSGNDYLYTEERKQDKKSLKSITSVFDDEIYNNHKVEIKKEEPVQHASVFHVFDDDLSRKQDIRSSTLYQDQTIQEKPSVVLEAPKYEPKEENDKKVEENEPKQNSYLLKEANVDTKEEIISQPKIDLANTPYNLPPLYLLKEANDVGTNQRNEEIAKEKADVLTNKIRELNVDAQITNYVVGPSVTRFEITLAAGVRVNTFVNLQEDFKLALGVNSIRIEAPIPGKSAIGIEVPNNYRSMVSLKEIITTLPPKKHKLYVPVGKDIGGMPISVAICDMPHCLISGATNSGKSVCANTIILSLLMNYKPSEVRMIMVDPKRVEMLFYTDIPHLLCPIITDASKAMVALDKLCKRMMERFDIFAKEGVKNIASYNEKMVSLEKDKMPFILLFVDELAELMLSKKSQIVEEKIQKLVQLGRAAGIHLVLSTQRPDVNVITGTIKSNIPCRMTFRLSSLVDSRTVIDVGGAEKLLNNGDMLLLTPDYTGLRRVQGVYVSDKEIADVVDHCKKELSPQYDPEFLDLRTEEEKQEELNMKFESYGNNTNSGSKNASDEALYEDIKRCVIMENKASASFIQRKFSLGYAKAARMLDRLEDEGIIGPENGSKGREVLHSTLKEEQDDGN